MNATDPASVGLLFRPHEERFDNPRPLRSDCDQELIVVVAFSSVVKVRALVLVAEEGRMPGLARLFKNEGKVDFETVQEVEPLEEILLNTAEAESWALLKPGKFQNVEKLVLHLKGQEQELGLLYLQVKGVDTKIKRSIVQTVYELKPAAAKSDPLSGAGHMPIS